MAEQDKRAELLRAFLAENDTPCPQCGYNLRMLTGDICPECGDRLVLGVRAAEPKQAALLTGLIGLSAGAGLNGLMLIYALIVMIRFGAPGNFGEFITVNVLGLIFICSLLVFWLSRWRWIRARNSALRWLMAAACWLASLIDLVVFSYKIR